MMRKKLNFNKFEENIINYYVQRNEHINLKILNVCILKGDQ